MGSANFRRCRRRSPWIIARTRRSVLNNSRSRSRSMSRNDSEYRMGLRKSATTREYDQVDVYSMICAAMGRALVGEDSGMGTTFLRAEEMIQATTDTTPSIGRHMSWKTTPNFHDTWAPTEYDRSGQISTFNHLTPLLAQQIKEELNNFKNTEMDVHENSKMYTHFF